MFRCRFLPALILCCALDLVVPVAPTPTGVEFEDDEEAVQAHGARSPKPDRAAPRAPDQQGTAAGQRARLLARSRPRNPGLRQPVTIRTELRLDATSSPPPISEDH
jgi:hypothetical protein